MDANKKMSSRQSFLKKFYPVLAIVNKLFKGNKGVRASDASAVESFYELEMKMNNGNLLAFDALKNKKVLIVNTASDCGYTNQYDGLQQLYAEFKDKLTILAFPANDFKQQENGDDASIAAFCKLNFNIGFPIMAKSIVLKNKDQNKVFAWLTDKTKNGWNESPPAWNFSKYLIDEKGDLTHIFASSVDPEDKRLLKAIKS